MFKSLPWFSRSRRFVAAAIVGVAGVAALGSAAHAADVFKAAVTIQNHRFSEAEIRVPVGQAIELSVTNKDTTPEEFEASALKIEKVVAAGTTIVLRFGPLKAGTYNFVGDFHEATAKGKIIAEPAK